MKNICLKLIDFYQKHISTHFRARCKYTPTCSNYTKQAIIKYGTLKGMYLGIKRILRCNPFSQGGYDPLE